MITWHCVQCVLGSLGQSAHLSLNTRWLTLIVELRLTCEKAAVICDIPNR